VLTTAKTMNEDWNRKQTVKSNFNLWSAEIHGRGLCCCCWV